MPELEAGQAFPDGVVFIHIPASQAGGDPRAYDASQEFKCKKVVLVSVPGAFTPTCQATHLASYLEHRDRLRDKHVDQVVVIAYNDPYVMAAWAKANGVADDFFRRLTSSGTQIFASDAGAKFSKSIGWTLGDRTARYAVVVDRGTVLYAGHDQDAKSIAQSGALAVLAKL